MSIEKLRPSFTFTEDRLRELQQVVPEAFTDGKINWDDSFSCSTYRLYMGIDLSRID